MYATATTSNNSSSVEFLAVHNSFFKTQGNRGLDFVQLDLISCLKSFLACLSSNDVTITSSLTDKVAYQRISWQSIRLMRNNGRPEDKAFLGRDERTGAVGLQLHE